MLKRFLPLATLAVVAVSSIVNAADKPFLHPLFTDHAVLQYGMEVPVWGWTQPGAVVRVSIQGKIAEATADANGKWMAKLPPLAAGGPFQLDVTGPQTAAVKDVLVGEVWVCSGQSNMEWPVLASADPDNEVKNATHPRLRLFDVPNTIAAEPQELVAAQWQACTPETIGNFSAVAYFFGRALQPEVDMPVGLIHTSWGGTVAEAWTSKEALGAALPEFQPAITALEQQVAEQKSGTPTTYEQQLAKWWSDNDPGSKAEGGWQAASVPADGWQPMALPVHWEDASLPAYDGIVWFRKTVEVPAELAGKTAVVELGPIDDRDDTWVNGQHVGSNGVWTVPRKYNVAANVLVAGANTVAVRVLDTGGGGGICGAADQLRLVVPVQDGVATEVVIPLNGEWQYQASAPLANLSPVPQPVGGNPNMVTVLYNGMIAPLLPCAVRGAIWYQGESNAGRAAQYRTLLPTMIGDWRNRFTSNGFSFMIVQLANFMAVQTTPVEEGWADLREAQALTAKNDPLVGIAIITDIGDAADIHPKNKQDVGKRLALQALAITYGKTAIVPGGPEFAELAIDGANAKVKFTNVGGGLVVRDGDLRGFAVAGADGKYAWGTATVAGDTVTVTSTEVPQPVSVRYNWANNPIGNLFNAEGLPAAPFRTDGPAQ
jgi:sialate O-acetylesterase